MRKTVSKQLRKDVISFMEQEHIDKRLFKKCYRRAKKDYNLGKVEVRYA